MRLPLMGMILLPLQPAFAQESQADSDIVVTGTRYRGEVSSGGARIDVNVRDLPLSISVATDELINDRQVRNLKEVADNIAGVQSRSGSGQFAAGFTVRGFQTFSNGLAQNGYRVSGFGSNLETQNVERVEFLKGPASVLYGGSGALGGLINIVTKTPQNDTFLEIDITGGTQGYGSAGMDANIELASTLDFRLNGAVTTDRVNGAFTDINAQSLAPSLRWRPVDGLSLLAEASWFHVRQPTSASINRPNYQILTTLPKDFKLGEPGDFSENTTSFLRLEGSWQIAPGVTLRQGINRQKITEDQVAIGAESFDSFTTPGIINRFVSPGSDKITQLTSQSELRLNFKTGPLSHKFLIGFEYSKLDLVYGTAGNFASIAPLDLNNPVYGTPIPVVPLDNPSSGIIETAKAGYVQNFIELGQFKALLGLRYDNVLNKTSLGADAFPPAKETAYSPRAGLVWEPSERSTLFVSWSKSFIPSPLVDAVGEILPPERGKQYEIGVRQDLIADRKLTVALSAFDMTRSNVGTCDPASVDCEFSISVGEQRAKGLEAELTGQLVSWFDIIATYAYVDAKVTKSVIAEVPVGAKLPEAAKHSASLFTRIGLDPVGLPDVAFSAGAYYTGSRVTSNAFEGPQDPAFSRIPAATRIDLGAFWDVSDVFRLQANITNLFDKRILEPTDSGFNRTTPFRATIGGNFKF
jgi:iron complex outermembrane recepter protein